MHGSGLCKVARLGGGVEGRICFDLSETLGKGERLLLELFNLTWSQCLWFLVVIGLGQAPQL